MHCYERRGIRPVTGLWLPDIQGRTHGKHSDGEGALLGWQNSKTLSTNSS
jgi:hypothetical protein